MSTIAIPRPAGASRALLMFMGFCTFLNLYATQSLLPLFERAFGASKVHVGLTVSATTLAVALASPFAGLVAERVERRILLAASILAIAATTLAAGLAPGLDALIAVRFLQGLAIPTAYVATMGYIGEAWGAEEVGMAMATYVTGNVLGGFSGRVLAGFLAAHLGWREAFAVLGLLALAGAAAVYAAVRPSAEALPTPVGWRALPGLFVDRTLAPTYAVGFGMLFTLVGLFTYVNFHLAGAPYGLGTAQLGLVFTVYLVGTVVTPIAGRWIDRLGARAIGAGALAASAVGIGLTLSPWLPLVIAGLAIAASGVFVGQSCATGRVGVAAGPRRGLAAGLYLGCYYAGGSLGGVLPGTLWGLGGWPACAALLAGAALLTAGMILAWWPRQA
jgi:predicted MFS family arabinose efflux permease